LVLNAAGVLSPSKDAKKKDSMSIQSILTIGAICLPGKKKMLRNGFNPSAFISIFAPQKKSINNTHEYDH